MLKPDDWRINTLGMRKGFQVRSIEQAICIMKLAYFNMGKLIPGLCLLVNPETLLDFTAKAITDAKLDPDCPNWINYLGTAYTEAYAQWFDSLGNVLREKVQKDRTGGKE